MVFMTWHSESPSQCTLLQSACVMFTLGGWYSPVKARTWNMLAWKCECRFSKMVRGFGTRAVFMCVQKKQMFDSASWGGTTAAGKGKPGPEMPAKKRKESTNGKVDAGAVQAVGTGSADGIGQPR